eukprot:COSAG01_NODE_17985_length_1108_cov_1.321110_1_plen_99_part_10
MQEAHRDADGTYVVFLIGGWKTQVGACNVTHTGSWLRARRGGGGGGRARSRQWHPPHYPNCTAPNWPKSCGESMPGMRKDLCGPCTQGLNCGCGMSVAS